MDMSTEILTASLPRAVGTNMAESDTSYLGWWIDRMLGSKCLLLQAIINLTLRPEHRIPRHGTRPRECVALCMHHVSPAFSCDTRRE